MFVPVCSERETAALVRVLGGCQMRGSVFADAMPELNDKVGYVSSSTPLPVLDTVREVLQFHADFAMHTTISKEQVESRAMQVVSPSRFVGF